MKKVMGVLLSTLLLTSAIAGCGASGAASFDPSSDITAVSREDGSGTRGAFIELFKIQETDATGKKVDKTTPEADVTNSTSVVLTKVARDPYAIGYVSLGSMNDTVKALKIDGAAATAENVSNGAYKSSRPFNIVTKGAAVGLKKDFISYIMSADGQKVITDNGYIAVSKNPAYSGTKPAGKIVVAGSSSVTPVMEKLKEAYLVINPNAKIEIQQSDSTTGISSTVSGICDIGMSSRELKDSEKNAGITSTEIAKDGIAVIVNKNNPTDNLTSEQVKSIYIGASTAWSDVVG